MEPRGLNPSAYEALADFRHALHHFLRFSERAVQACGLDPQEYQLLLSVKGIPQRATIDLLAEQLEMEHARTVQLINGMESRGLVLRIAGRTGGSVELTPYAESLLPLLATFHCSELRSSAPTLLRALETLLEL
jgi:DNA-binding MarR family transcriptional regulator